MKAEIRMGWVGSMPTAGASAAGTLSILFKVSAPRTLRFFPVHRLQIFG
jgi:hypothetical protein